MEKYTQLDFIEEQDYLAAEGEHLKNQAAELREYNPNFKQKLATKVIRNIERKYATKSFLSQSEIQAYTAYTSQ